MAEEKIDRERILVRLKRLEGQVRGVQRMIEEGQPCEDVLTQVSAARAALDKIGVFVIAGGMRDCLRRDDGPEIDPVVLEDALGLFIKHFGRMA